MDLILASTSPIRRTLLADAGVPCTAVPPDVDEDIVKEGFIGSDAQLASHLAAAKALPVSRREPDALVIGSDSLVSIEGRRFSKPANRAEAAEHLRFLSGKLMTLTGAVVLVRGGEVVWQHAEEARLHVRTLSDAFIETYLQADWPEVSYCVGVFRLEGPGAQLFERIEGDHFTILGLSLLPLLGALRSEGVLVA